MMIQTTRKDKSKCKRTHRSPEILCWSEMQVGEQRVGEHANGASALGVHKRYPTLCRTCFKPNPQLCLLHSKNISSLQRQDAMLSDNITADYDLSNLMKRLPATCIIARTARLALLTMGTQRHAVLTNERSTSSGPAFSASVTNQ